MGGAAQSANGLASATFAVIRQLHLGVRQSEAPPARAVDPVSRLSISAAEPLYCRNRGITFKRRGECRENQKRLSSFCTSASPSDRARSPARTVGSIFWQCLTTEGILLGVRVGKWRESQCVTLLT